MRVTLGRLAVGMVLVGASCTRGRELTRSDVTVSAEPGAPLPGLTPEELARFEAGRAVFSKVYTPEEGLGPLYTENSCNACHHEPRGVGVRHPTAPSRLGLVVTGVAGVLGV